MLDGLRRRHGSHPSPRPLSLNFTAFSAPPPSPDIDSSDHPIRSIHNAVIAVFQKKGLADNELYVLNEGVRHLLKTELGSFFTEYLQNQLLTKGMVILRDKIRFYEGQKSLDSLAETWDFFFCDGKEPNVRQLALLHFRNTIVLSRVVSPYLGTHGLYSGDGSVAHCSCVIEKHLQWCWPKQPVDQPSKSPVVRSKSYNIPLLLTPVAECDPDASSVGSGGIRRHSACEIISCLEEQGLAYANMASRSNASTSSASANRLCVVPQFRGTMESPLPSHSILHCPGTLHGTQATMTLTDMAKATRSSPPSGSSSPDTVTGQVLESLDLDSDGIFIEFPPRCS
ncbi:unnamed protein product, partial [Coregonus sp. 'balchen']